MLCSHIFVIGIYKGIPDIVLQSAAFYRCTGSIIDLHIAAVAQEMGMGAAASVGHQHLEGQLLNAFSAYSNSQLLFFLGCFDCTAVDSIDPLAIYIDRSRIRKGIAGGSKACICIGFIVNCPVSNLQCNLHRLCRIVAGVHIEGSRSTGSHNRGVPSAYS